MTDAPTPAAENSSPAPPPSAAPPHAAAEIPRPVPGVAALCLYEGDLLNRLLSRIGLGARRPAHLAARAALLLLITWLPMALMAVVCTPALYSKRIEAANFFADFAAYAQFWIGLPLFILAEAIVSIATRSAGLEFAASGVVRTRDLPRLDALHRRFNRLQRQGWSDLICFGLGCAFSIATIWTEFHHAPAHTTWHTFVSDGQRRLTAPGIWEFFVALPVLNYWWLRHIWKVLVWWLYLRVLSRFRLDLVATHPDNTGGIGFISQVQGHFAWIILAYGITNVAATVGYKMAFEGADLSAPPVWGPILGFMVGAPILFLLPLFMFTRQLYRTKRSARRLYRRRVMEQARLFEHALLPKPAAERASMEGAVDLNVMAQFSRLFDACQQMRVVPFDWRSASQIFGSTFGPLASILPAIHLQGPLSVLLEVVTKIAGSQGNAPH